MGLLGFEGNILAKVGETEKKLGNTEKEFVQKCSDCFLQPLKSFLEGQMKTIMVNNKKILWLNYVFIEWYGMLI